MLHNIGRYILKYNTHFIQHILNYWFKLIIIYTLSSSSRSAIFLVISTTTGFVHNNIFFHHIKYFIWYSQVFNHTTSNITFWKSPKSISILKNINISTYLFKKETENICEQVKCIKLHLTIPLMYNYEFEINLNYRVRSMKIMRQDMYTFMIKA